MKVNWKFVLDLAERTAATYAQTFLGLLLLNQAGAFSIDMVKAAAVASAPAALAVIKAAFKESLVVKVQAPAKADAGLDDGFGL